MGEQYVLGVDLGGTNVRCQAFSSSGEPAGERIEQKSQAREGVDQVVKALVEVIQQAEKSCPHMISAVGMAVPGHIDDENGMVVWAPNFGTVVDGIFHYWEKVPLKKLLNDHIPHKIVMGNDANVAALGEYSFGTGKGTAQCLVMLTLGTGVGGGVVFSPKSLQGEATKPLLLTGANQGGGELGHILVQRNGMDCNTGAYGSLEAYCGSENLKERVIHRLRRGEPTVIREWIKDNYKLITPKMLFDAAELNDELALQIWDEFGVFLGSGIGSLINVFAPDVIAIGGKLSSASEFFMDRVKREAKSIAIPSLYKQTNLTTAQLVDEAGLVGGAALALAMTS